MNQTQKKTLVLQELATIRMDIVDTLLATSVDREARVDQDLAKDLIKQEKLKNFIRGLSVLYYFSFLQANVSKKQWTAVRNPRISVKDAVPPRQGWSLDWESFDIYLYVRDCFAHNWEGVLFSNKQENTKRFNSIIMAKGASYPVSVDAQLNRLLLCDGAPFQCLQLVRDYIKDTKCVVK